MVRCHDCLMLHKRNFQTATLPEMQPEKERYSPASPVSNS